MFSLPSSTTVGCNSDRKPFDGGSFLLFLFCSLLLPRSLYITTKSHRNDDVIVDISPSLHRTFPKMILVDVVSRWCGLLASLPLCPYARMSRHDDNASVRLSSPFPPRRTSITYLVVVLSIATIPATVHYRYVSTVQLLSKI